MKANPAVCSVAGILLGFLLMYPYSIDADKFRRLKSNIACLTLYKNELKANGKIDIALYEQTKNLSMLYCALHVKHLAFKNAIIYHNCNTLWKQIYKSKNTPPDSCNKMKDLLYKFSKHNREELFKSIKKMLQDNELDNIFNISASSRKDICDFVFYDRYSFIDEKPAEEIKKEVESEIKEKIEGKIAYEVIGQRQTIFKFMPWLMATEAIYALITGDPHYKQFKNPDRYFCWESPVLITFYLAEYFWKNVDENYNRYGLTEDDLIAEESVINIIRDMEMEKLAYFDVAVITEKVVFFKEETLKSYAKNIRDDEDSGKGFEFKVDWMKLQPSLSSAKS